MGAELHGKRILITRIINRSQVLLEKIQAAGGVPVSFPFFTVEPLADKNLLLEAIRTLSTYDMAVFVSPSAVEFTFSEILSRGEWPINVRAVSVGEGTLRLLTEYGVKKIISPSELFSTEGLLLHPSLDENQVRGKRILIFCAQGGRQLLTQTLIERGACVERVICYLRKSNDIGELLSLINNKSIDAICLFSSESLYKIQALADTDKGKEYRASLWEIPLFTPHERIARQAEGFGWENVVLTGFSDQEIVQGMGQFKWFKNE